MAEVEFVARGISVQYTGPFNKAVLLKTLNGTYKRLGFPKIELKTVESVSKKGKCTKQVNMYPKTHNDYAKEIHEVAIFFTDIKPKTVTENGKRKTIQEGSVKINIDAYIKTDYETRWEGKAFYYFLRVLWNKYVWGDMLDEIRSQAKNNANQAITEVRAYLNIGRF